MDVAIKIRLIVGEFKGLEKALVFCPTKKQTESWIEHFKCSILNLGTNDKGNALLKWTFRLMFATGSFGAGVDIDGTKVIIYIGILYRMVDFD
jgi:hypothetical protein